MTVKIRKERPMYGRNREKGRDILMEKGVQIHPDVTFDDPLDAVEVTRVPSDGVNPTP